MGQVLCYRGCKSLLFFSVLGLLFFSSCRSTQSFTSPLPEEYSIRMSKSSASGYKNVKRVRKYEFAHRDVPAAFDGCRLGFVSDLHYRSLLKEKGLRDITRLLNDLRLDALLIGGDLHEGCEYVPDVIAALGAVKTPLGTYAVLGNNDYEACYDDILKEMERQGIHLLEHEADTLKRNGGRIVIAGVRNPFNLGQNGQSPTLSLSPDDFVILLSHTPDYAEDVPVTNTDLVLAGHTHGGQVTLFGLYAPVIPSRYGQRFLTGLRYNSNNTPIIITNGIGTSRKNVRFFAPSEVVVITLRRFVNIEHTMHYE
ncbi:MULTISPECIES: metallophosphoesterase [Bacteroides]|jgi:predicted MPP superfamily phosphohydrolase|uniref:metallophosphoesterase n=1 Tax=Bacteroides TaxID=816 RepID=UPI000ACCD19A|nr:MULTISPECIES: metallophosphoesterase [Bacteroides]